MSMGSVSDLDGVKGQAAHWSLRLFGGFELTALATGEKVALPGKRERVLLACLALSPNSRQPRRKLATLLWGDSADETALDNLRTTIWRLRKALSDTERRFVLSDGEDVVIHSTAFEIDVVALRRLAAEPASLERAAGLYMGELLCGLDIENEEFESWRRAEAARYRELVVDVLARLMQQMDESGGRERAIETGIRILQLDPLNERVVRKLMRLYAASGRRGAALQLYRTLTEALRSELDAEPETETRAVLAEITRGENAAENLQPVSRIGTQPPNPPTPSAPAQDVAVSLAPRKQKAAVIAWLAGTGVAAALAVFLVYQLTPSGTASHSPSVNEAAQTPSPAVNPISLAVLPFVNLSGDPAQDFFSDGMTEESTAALSKLPGLLVVARTSAFQFKGKNVDLKTAGKQLGATHLIEGSVRKAGERVRVTVQLIDARTGNHVWTENYDREVADILSLQDDIARAIALSLRLPLGLNPGETLVAKREIDPDSYQQFLRAKQLVRARTRGAAKAIEILEALVARNPGFAPAWVQLSRAYAAFIVANENAPNEELRRIRVAYGQKRESAAKHAVELDAYSADAYWALGMSQFGEGSLRSREELFSKALALDPNNPDILTSYGQQLLRAGRLKEALAILQKVVELEPFVPVYTGNLGEALWLNGQNEAALTVLKSGPRGNARSVELARVYASMGRFSDAADAVLESPTGMFPATLVADASRLLRTAPAKTAAPETLPRLGSFGFTYLYVGAPMRALELHEELAETGGGGTALLWHSSYAPVRKSERFKTLMRKVGLVDYWRAKGWPDLCHPVGVDDFACN
jgi:TolB-like protein/DNA-binding SARP family transcriptional activator